MRINKLKILICLIFITSLVHSQNIFTALQLNENKDYKTGRPKKIVENNIFYSSSGKQVEKDVKTFDKAGMLLMEERFDEEGSQNARLIYTNDTSKKIVVTRSFERWTQQGYSKEIALYFYDNNNHLTGITEKDSKGNIIMQTNLVLNERGDPVELSLFDGKGNLIGKENAHYINEKNKVVTSVIANNGKIVSIDTSNIRMSQAPMFANTNETYNLNGDPTRWIRHNRNGTETIYEAEYLYDKLGNCLENKIYKIITKENGKQKRELERVYKKQYTYW